MHVCSMRAAAGGTCAAKSRGRHSFSSSSVYPRPSSRGSSGSHTYELFATCATHPRLSAPPPRAPFSFATSPCRLSLTCRTSLVRSSPARVLVQIRLTSPRPPAHSPGRPAAAAGAATRTSCSPPAQPPGLSRKRCSLGTLSGAVPSSHPQGSAHQSAPAQHDLSVLGDARPDSMLLQRSTSEDGESLTLPGP